MVFLYVAKMSIFLGNGDLWFESLQQYIQN